MSLRKYNRFYYKAISLMLSPLYEQFFVACRPFCLAVHESFACFRALKVHECTQSRLSALAQGVWWKGWPPRHWLLHFTNKLKNRSIWGKCFIQKNMKEELLILMTYKLTSVHPLQDQGPRSPSHGLVRIEVHARISRSGLIPLRKLFPPLS